MNALSSSMAFRACGGRSLTGAKVLFSSHLRIISVFHTRRRTWGCLHARHLRPKGFNASATIASALTASRSRSTDCIAIVRRHLEIAQPHCYVTCLPLPIRYQHCPPVVSLTQSSALPTSVPLLTKSACSMRKPASSERSKSVVAAIPSGWPNRSSA